MPASYPLANASAWALRDQHGGAPRLPPHPPLHPAPITRPPHGRCARRIRRRTCGALQHARRWAPPGVPPTLLACPTRPTLQAVVQQSVLGTACSKRVGLTGSRVVPVVVQTAAVGLNPNTRRVIAARFAGGATTPTSWTRSPTYPPRRQVPCHPNGWISSRSSGGSWRPRWLGRRTMRRCRRPCAVCVARRCQCLQRCTPPTSVPAWRLGARPPSPRTAAASTCNPTGGSRCGPRTLWRSRRLSTAPRLRRTSSSSNNSSNSRHCASRCLTVVVRHLVHVLALPLTRHRWEACPCPGHRPLLSPVTPGVLQLRACRRRHGKGTMPT